MALSKLVGRVEWVAGNTAMIGDEHWSTERAAAQAITEKVAETLHQAASLICDGDGHPVDDPARISAVQDSTRALDELIDAELAADVAALTEADADRRPRPRRRAGDATRTGASRRALDPGFHARALGIATEMVADAALEAAGADAVVDRRLGMGDASTPNLFAHRLLSHLSFRSVWFRNALRGARRAGARRRGGRGHQRPARLLGGARAPCRCCAPTRWAPARPPCAPSAGRRWASSSARSS